MVPTKYAQIALSIKTLIDLSTLTIEDVTGLLKAVDDRVKAMAWTTASRKLLLTEEWATRMRERQPEEGSFGSSGRGGAGKCCGKPPQRKKDDDSL